MKLRHAVMALTSGLAAAAGFAFVAAPASAAPVPVAGFPTNCANGDAGCPLVTIRVVCDASGGHIQVKLFDTAALTYDVFVDDMVTPLFSQPLLDTGNEYLDLGVYANGMHKVAVNWLEAASAPPYYENAAVSVACVADQSGSGAGGPAVGGDVSPILIVGAVLLAMGAALLATRRLYRA